MRMLYAAFVLTREIPQHRASLATLQCHNSVAIIVIVVAVGVACHEKFRNYYSFIRKRYSVTY